MQGTELELGEITADAAYALREFQRRTGMADTALRHARQRGLRVRAVGRKRFVVGADWIAFLEATTSAQE